MTSVWNRFVDSSHRSDGGIFSRALRKRINPIAALADQVWLSLLNFAISLAFLWVGTKESYGIYTLLFAPVILVQSVQNALINSPLATVLPAAPEADRQLIRATAVSFHVFLAFGCGGAGILGLLAYGRLVGLPLDPLLIVGFAGAICGAIARESQRSLAYAEGLGVKALAGDLIYGFVLLSGIGIAMLGSSLSASLALLIAGVAGVAPVLFVLPRVRALRVHTQSARLLWSCGRWALPSVIVTWISLSSYPYFAERNLGLSAVADIGASRMLLMPVGLVMTAWGNWFRPKISGWLADGNTHAVRSTISKSTASILVGSAVIAVGLVYLYPFLERLLGPQYRGLRPLMLAWLLYFAISFVRNVHMAALMSSASGYRTLHHIAWFGLSLSVVGLSFFSANGAVWIIGALCAVEGVQLLLIMGSSRRRLIVSNESA